MRLFDLTQQYLSLTRLDDADEIPEEVIRDTLEALGGDIETKCVAIGRFILDMQASAQVCKETAKAMAQRAERLAKRADSIKHYMLLQLQLMDLKRIQTPDLTIRRQNSPPTVVITDGITVPEEYMAYPPPPPPHPDKKLLKAALQAGKDIPGVFIEQGEHIRIEI